MEMIMHYMIGMLWSLSILLTALVGLMFIVAMLQRLVRALVDLTEFTWRWVCK